MCDWILALLFRLYPRAFRDRYLREALLLCRDRRRSETGVYRRVRLVCDLLVDFAAGLAPAYRNTYAITTSAQVCSAGTGIPEFRTLEEEALRPGAVMMGGISGIAALALFIFVMNHAAAYHPFSGSVEGLKEATAGSQANPDVQAVAERLEQQLRGSGLLQTCFFEKLELHPGNIGYVKLTWFANPASCSGVAEAVMQHLNKTDAVIFDLRDARGGYPEMVRLMAGWLFDHPVTWYNPRAEAPAQLMTDSPVAGSRLADKPIFVLTSSRTFSGAEHFAYNLKTLKRATIVGETTSGASHAGIGTQPSRSGASDAKPFWEGSGVQPDVRVDAAKALQTAEKLALAAIRRR